METEIIEAKKGAAMGIKIIFQKSNLVIIRAERGFLGCGYFSPETLEKMKESAAIVPGVNSFEEMLNRKVTYATKAAAKLGVKKGMSGRAALERMV